MHAILEFSILIFLEWACPNVPPDDRVAAAAAAKGLYHRDQQLLPKEVLEVRPGRCGSQGLSRNDEARPAGSVN